MFCCTRGHEVHIECVKKQLTDEKQQEFNTVIALSEFDNYEIPEKFCPVCQLRVLKPEDELRFVYSLLGKTREELRDLVTKRFATYEEFQFFLSEKAQKKND